MPTPIVVSKAGALKNPDVLATLTTTAAGAGITLAGKRYGYGPPATPPNKVSSAKPMFGVAGAEASGTQSADAGVATVFPSQFCFPTTKYANAARLRGMA